MEDEYEYKREELIKTLKYAKDVIFKYEEENDICHGCGATGDKCRCEKDEECMDCRNPTDECTCDKCHICNRRLESDNYRTCECFRCEVCDEYEDDCSCDEKGTETPEVTANVARQ